MMPTIKGLGKPMTIDIGEIKRLYFEGGIEFECPSCGHTTKMDFEDDPIEYGALFAPDCCDECDQEFDEVDFDISATITLSVK